MEITKYILIIMLNSRMLHLRGPSSVPDVSVLGTPETRALHHTLDSAFLFIFRVREEIFDYSVVVLLRGVCHVRHMMIVSKN